MFTNRQKIKLSQTYVNKHGQIVKDRDTMDKVALRVRRMFKMLPFMVSFILCALLVIQFLCLIGITNSMLNPSSTGDFGIYTFLCITISAVCTFSFGFFWFFADEIEQKTVINPFQINNKYF